ncbi:hypothetical protein K1719_005887 [Acacia pycnantha]|nr:hypothetical protein K1719_005887 [Acacia pycnantha]
MASSSKLRRNTCSFTGLLLSCLNFTLFILSVSSFAPTILLRTPPTSFGMAFLLVSAISLFSSFIGFYSQLTHFCFITHISLLLASLISLILSILALFTKEKIVVLVLSCAAHSCRVKEYQELEAKTETSARKRSKRMARVQEEAMVNVNKMDEEKAKEFDGKMRSKYGQSMMKTEFEP